MFGGTRQVKNYATSGCPKEGAVRIFVEFQSLAGAMKAVQDLDGRYFAKRRISAVYVLLCLHVDGWLSHKHTRPFPKQTSHLDFVPAFSPDEVQCECVCATGFACVCALVLHKPFVDVTERRCSPNTDFFRSPDSRPTTCSRNQVSHHCSSRNNDSDSATSVDKKVFYFYKKH